MAVFVASPSGIDSASGSELAPFRTMHKGVSVLNPGDILYLRGALWQELTFFDNIPGGTSWGATVKIASWPGERATIKPLAVDVNGVRKFCYLSGNSFKYIWLDDLTFDLSNCRDGMMTLTRPSIGVQSAHHIRVSNSECKNSPNTCFTLSYSADGCEFLNLNVHDVGLTPDININEVTGAQAFLYGYGWYMRSSGCLIEGCEVWRTGSSGMQVYSNEAATEPPLNNVIRKNNFHHTSLFGSTQSPARGAAVSLASGSGHEVYNNLFWENFNEGGRVSYSSSTKWWHNTFYKNKALGLLIANNPATVKNNGFWQNGNSSLAQQLVDQSSGSTKLGNRFDDPRFVQP